jgi:hypothetical protein
MKTLQEQYNLIKEDRGNKEILLKTAKQLYPNIIPNHFTYDQTVPLLKQRGIIYESIGGVVTKGKDPDWFSIFKENINEAKAIEKKPTKDVVDMETKGFDYKNKENIDNIYGQAFLIGYYAEMKDPANANKTVDDLKAIVAKNLYKDPLYYVKNGQFGTKGVGYTDEAPGLTASKTDQMTPIPDQVKLKASKTDLGDREKKTGAAKKVKGEMTVVPKSSKGVKKMPLPGKEKKIKLQENIGETSIRSTISQIIKEELKEMQGFRTGYDAGEGDDGPQPPDNDMSSEMIWNSLSDDTQEELLTSYIKDFDEAIFFVGKEWDSIPDDVTANILRDERFHGEIDLDEAETIVGPGAKTPPSGMKPETFKVAADKATQTGKPVSVVSEENEDFDYNPEMFDDVYYQQIEDLEQQLTTTTDPKRAEELQRKIDTLMKGLM